jgi:hypothetical protein
MAPDGVLNGQSHSEQSNMQIDGSCGVVLGLRKLEKFLLVSWSILLRHGDPTVLGRSTKTW